MTRCACGSYAINHHAHGRDGSDGHLCDVCYWRTRAEAGAADAARYRWLAAHAMYIGFPSCAAAWSLVVDGPSPKRHDDADAIDEAIDAAMMRRACE